MPTYASAYSDDFADLAFCVDVLHHLADHAQMFHELARTVRGRGCFIAVTDSVEDIEGRSLTHFFPETRPIELKRYPKLESLVGLAAPAGFELLERASVLGELEIDAELLRALGEKCASSLRLIDESAHRRGTERVLEAGQRGERWVSRYTVLRFQRGETPA